MASLRIRNAGFTAAHLPRRRRHALTAAAAAHHTAHWHSQHSFWLEWAPIIALGIAGALAGTLRLIMASR